MSPPQKRLSKFTRQPDFVAGRQITDRTLKIIEIVARYRFLPTSMLLQLVEGNERVTHRHLQQLFHKGLINRFSFPKPGTPGEFHYYLDNPKALELLILNGRLEQEQLDSDAVKRNKEKAYFEVNDPKKSQQSAGRLLFLQHEVMISRFHFMLEMACNKSNGAVELLCWRQGPALYNTVVDEHTGEVLPHRPDAFFTLHFPKDPEGRNRAHFFYEADRKTTSIPKMMQKLTAHLEFIRQKKHEHHYGISRVRAVLIETLDVNWAEDLRQSAERLCSLPIFWFTASEILTVEKPHLNGKTRPIFLRNPELVLRDIWVAANGRRMTGLCH
jgi:hypothetical protein